MIADRKITYESGSYHVYKRKLFGDLAGVIQGSSGTAGMFELYRNHVIDYVKNLSSFPAQLKRLQSGNTHESLELKLSEFTQNINNRFHLHYSGFEVLAARQQPGAATVLTHFNQDGLPDTILTYKPIGSGAPYGSIFLKQIWKPEMSMEQVAELGYFIIKYIEHFELDLAVGVESNAANYPNNHPQIWFVPDNTNGTKHDYEADKLLLEKFEKNTEVRLKKCAESIIRDFNL